MNRISRRLFSTNSASIRTRFDQPWPHPTTSFIQGKAWASFRIPRATTASRLVQENDPRKDFLDCIRAFDRLSDILCRVIDLAESIRNLHPNQLWINAANQAHSLLSRYMNTLNTHKELYDALNSHSPDYLQSNKTILIYLQQKQGRLQFLRDFQRHGSYISKQKKGRNWWTYPDEMLSVRKDVFLRVRMIILLPLGSPKNEAKQLGNGFVSDLEFNHNQRSEIDPSDWHAHTLLRQNPDPSVRKRIWFSQRNSTDDQIELLENLLKLRYQFARFNWEEELG
ncbi:hypothetical protein Pst134EA_011748 [Puccinia striiformis f. sp. tritici]|uniref:hypothetical protein n=1 Tax=Puccinia striiformis f. sp. tritici TaxID=168172 RepID=UPI0020084F69|nr:hypothetical protein Pst134EA_011748 [Puccinia striiformis f. sp. tritici]KAH9468127.1 hypothetical protein Pst134EA_011748 [Puccinia striiformis f. sp. tritici]